MTKKVPLIIRDFHSKWGMWDTLSSSKEEISTFHIWSFENGKSPLGENVIFLMTLQIT